MSVSSRSRLQMLVNQIRSMPPISESVMVYQVTPKSGHLSNVAPPESPFHRQSSTRCVRLAWIFKAAVR